MTKPETEGFTVLKAGLAPKVGARGAGRIGYELSTDPARSALFVAITSNEGGGYFSAEKVPVAAVVEMLKQHDPKEPLASPMFRPLFVGKSANNGGFLAAILRSESLLAPVPDRAHLHQLAGDPAAWQARWLNPEGAAVGEQAEKPARKAAKSKRRGKGPGDDPPADPQPGEAPIVA